MKTAKTAFGISILTACLCAFSAHGQTIMIEDFDEYTNSDAALQAAWVVDAAESTNWLSPYVSAYAVGTNSMGMQLYFPNDAWQTDIINGPLLTNAISIDTNQYISMEIAGDPEFTNGTYAYFYIYVFATNGNFGRWGGAIPTANTNWQVFNFPASTIAVPWNSPGLPDLDAITNFAFYIYGEGATPGANAYTATIYVNDLQIRDTPLIEFPPPSPLRQVIENFDEFTSSASLTNFYTWVNSDAVGTNMLLEPWPLGSHALDFTIDFGSNQYPWSALLSGLVPPFSFPSNAVATFWLQGDTNLASVADGGTEFWLSFFDAAGDRFVFNTASAPVISSNWMEIQAPYNQFWSYSGGPVDTGNLVQWEFLVEAYEGTTNSPGTNASFGVADIMITVPPELSVVVLPSGVLQLQMNALIASNTYTLKTSPDLIHWTTTTIQATSTNATWSIPAGQPAGFYQLYYSP
jgi:hypothetical protein